MTIKKARKLLGDESLNLTDEQVQESIETARFFAIMTIDKLKNMTSKEKKKMLNK